MLCALFSPAGGIEILVAILICLVVDSLVSLVEDGHK